MTKVEDNVISMESYMSKARPGARACIVLPEHQDPLCVTQKTQIIGDAEGLGIEMEERIKQCIIYTYKGEKAYFSIYGRNDETGIIDRLEHVRHDKLVSIESTPIYKLLHHTYSLQEEAVKRVVKHAMLEHSVRNPTATIGDGESLVFWKKDQAYIDVYSDGLFYISPKTFKASKAPDISGNRMQGMIRYLMRTSGVEPPKGKISFTKAGMKKLRKVPDFHIFEFDMKLDASKVAKPHKPINIIRVTVGGSAVGKTKRVYLLTDLFGTYGTCNAYINDSQFASKDRPLVVCGIDEATTMRFKGQKALERKSTLAEVELNLKYEAIMTWKNPTFYWITANQQPEESGNDIRIIGRNQRWMVRITIGGSKEFAEDVGWGIDRDGDNSEWNEDALGAYVGVLRHFYDPVFQPIGTPENCQKYTSVEAWRRHIHIPEEDGGMGNEEKYNREIIRQLGKFSLGNFMEFKALHKEKRPFTPTEFKEAFGLRRDITPLAIGKFLRAFQKDTGLELADKPHEAQRYLVADWDLFEKAIRQPVWGHMKPILKGVK